MSRGAGISALGLRWLAKRSGNGPVHTLAITEAGVGGDRLDRNSGMLHVLARGLFRRFRSADFQPGGPSPMPLGIWPSEADLAILRTLPAYALAGAGANPSLLSAAFRDRWRLRFCP